MVMLAGLRDTEADWNGAQECRIRQGDADGLEVGAGVEPEFVFAGPEPIALQQRLVATAVVVGPHVGSALAPITVQAIEFDPDTGGRPRCRARGFSVAP